MRFLKYQKYIGKRLCESALAAISLSIFGINRDRCSLYPARPILAETWQADPNSVSVLECAGKRFLSWAEKNGIKVKPGLNLRRTEDRGSGLFSSAECSEGNVLVSIPRGLVINADNIELGDDIGHLAGTLRSAGLDERGVLVLWLVHQMMQPETSRWGPYISLFPSDYDLYQSHLLLLDVNLSGTPLDIAVREMKQNICRQSHAVVKSIKRLEQPAGAFEPLSPSEIETLWKRAHALVLTRSSVLSCTLEESDWTEQHVSILPVVDFCNHSDDPNAKVRVETDGSVSLVAIRRIPSDQEVVISYWPSKEPLGCEQSLFSYGFLSNLDRFAFPGIHFSGAEESPMKAIQRLLYMDRKSSQNHPPETVFLDELELALDYFSIECMRSTNVNSLIRSYIDEGGVGDNCRVILQDFRPAAKLKVLEILSSWRNQVRLNEIRSGCLNEYLNRLENAIRRAIETIDIHYCVENLKVVLYYAYQGFSRKSATKYYPVSFGNLRNHTMDHVFGKLIRH